MATEFKRIILRNDKKLLGIPALSVGEPYFISDTGELVFKIEDGSFVTLKELENGVISYEHLSESLQIKLKTLDEKVSKD